MADCYPKFFVGQLVHHKRFDYRGVIVDVDAAFEGTDAWYEQVAKSKPPKDQPWYHVIVDGGEHLGYVAERHLEPDASGNPISHPAVDKLFNQFENGVYYRPRH